MLARMGNILIRLSCRNFNSTSRNAEAIHVCPVNVLWTPDKCPKPHEFKYKEIAEATSNFSGKYYLGEGGFGIVHKGFLQQPDSKKLYPVAVKSLKEGSHQGLCELLAEIVMLRGIRHPNLVTLIGFCVQPSRELLVYEFLPCGSLDYYMTQYKGVQPLDWQTRVRIACDAAKGLAFLHANNIIHRDFKAANILLDENKVGKLSDFGLAKNGPVGQNTHLSTAILGTLGYVDPDYARTGHLTTKSDVYGFGVLLLELLTGRKAMSYRIPRRPESLTSWAAPYLQSRPPNIRVLADPELGSQGFPPNVARILARQAYYCIQDEPKKRPCMQDVSTRLGEIVELERAGKVGTCQDPSNGNVRSSKQGQSYSMR